MHTNDSLSAFICKLEMVSIEDVHHINRTSEYSNEIVLKTDKLFETILFTPGSGEYLSEQKHLEAGPFFENTVSVFYPGNSEESQGFFAGFHNRRFLVRVTLMSGLCHLLGSLEYPIAFQVVFDAVKGGRTLSFLWQSSIPPTILTI